MKASNRLSTSSSPGTRMKASRALRSPVARMIAAGGVVHVPPEAYLRRLQRLVRTGHSKAHAYSLYPGIAHIAVASDARLASFFRSILSVSEGGIHLQGLESLFLSCLQGIEVSGRSKLALAALAAWTHFRADKSQTPLVIVDRGTNQFKFLPLSAVEKTLRAISSDALLRRSVWDVISSLEQERAGATIPSAKDPRTGSDAPDDPWTAGTCKENVKVWAGYGKAGAAGIGAAVGMGGSSLGGLGAGVGSAFVQIADAVIDDLVVPLANFGCDKLFPPGSELPGGGAPDWQDPIDDDGWLPYEPTLGPGQMPDSTTPGSTSTTPGSTSTTPGSTSTTPGSTPGGTDDTTQTDPEKEWNQWPSTSDGSSPPPPPPGDAEGTPNPEDDNGHYAKPPGFQGPWPPGGELPNPDDIGGGPTSFPNGAVFVPARTIRALALLTRTSVTVAQIDSSQSGTATFQLSVNSSALGSGRAT
jgi:hypothetical protein